MAAMTTIAVVGVALKAINSAIDLYKDQTPDWEQKQAKNVFGKQRYLEDLYEVELKKPRFEEGKDNSNARSTDRLLNLRDMCLSHGEKVIETIRSAKG